MIVLDSSTFIYFKQDWLKTISKTSLFTIPEKSFFVYSTRDFIITNFRVTKELHLPHWCMQYIPTFDHRCLTVIRRSPIIDHHTMYSNVFQGMMHCIPIIVNKNILWAFVDAIPLLHLKNMKHFILHSHRLVCTWMWSHQWSCQDGRN